MQESNRYTDIEHDGNAPYSPLSFQQERILYLNKLSADGPLWNRISCKRLLGDIDLQLLRSATAAIIERHAVLRTKISLVDGSPRQSTHEALDAFDCIDLSAQPPTEVEARARGILNQEYEKPLFIEGGQLFKVVVIRCSDSELWVILKLHHIISDERTLRILWNDLKVSYNSQLRGGEGLRPLDLDYFDYAGWLRRQFAEAQTGEQESFWLRQFAGKVPELDLPTDFAAPPTLTFRGELIKQTLSQEVIKRLRTFSLEKRVIPFSTMLSAYYLLLHYYCRQDDMVIGTVFSGRHYSPKIKFLAGFFSNTVALRAQIDDAQTVGDFVKTTHARVTDAYQMQDYPFERLVGRLDPDREQKRNPLFRALFNMVTGYEESQTFAGVIREEWLEPDISATQVDFFLDFYLNSTESELRIEYNSDIFLKATIQRMLRHYLTIVEKIMDSPATLVGDLGMVSAAEERLVLTFSAGELEAGAGRSIVGLLEERAARSPEQAALLFGDEVITCGEFNQKVNRLAATLIQAGVKEGDPVAIMLDRSPELVFGIFAILKAGAAYVPIDPGFPQQRIEYILQNCGARCLLVHSSAASAPDDDNGAGSLKRIAIDRADSYAGEGDNPGRDIDPSSAAYVIYTSGSTGKPKGVVVEHRAVMNTVEFLEARYPLAGKTILLKTNFTFDVSGAELFGWLFDGGRLAVLDKDAERDPARLLAAIDKYAVTHINFVPSMLDAFLAGLKERDIPTLEKLKYVFVAGEAVKPDLVNRFHAMVRNVRLEDIYGPTEAAIYATWYALPREENLKVVPIGRPISNTRAYILDDQLRLMPVGLTGELCLSGAGLARGYLNEPELTNEKFCPNPYWQGQRLYRTGDLAKWTDDGLIQFLGRGDGQVKIRGFRVELGEVERKLLGCRAVAEAAVIAKPDQFGQRGLVAYLVMKDHESASIEDVRGELGAWLPNYMIPDSFVELARLPRLASGKIDLQGLPEPDGHRSTIAEPAAAVTELEQTVIEIAERLLNTTGLTPESNFFRLGGNSLLTLRFIAALDATLGTSLSVIDFLELPTISEIARLIEPSMSPSSISREIVIGEPKCCTSKPANKSFEEVRP